MNDDTLTIEINGQAIAAKPGQMLIQVADAAGIHIPRFCYHPKLSVAANCRMCLVEVERSNKPLPACSTPVAPGMKVLTRSRLALQAQKSVMEFLLINHPLDCPICDQGGECELQDLAMGYGRDISRFQERKRVVTDPDLGALVATDMTRCIHCTRCVRFCEEIAGAPELGATGRGEELAIGTYIEQALTSELSGNVIDLCPVGALTSKPFRFQARAWEMQQHASIAPHDCVGSNLYLQVRANRVLRVVPRSNEALNEVWISDRDRFSYTGLYTADRALKPAIKRAGQWFDVTWDTAFDFVTTELDRVREQRGAHALGALSSPGATVEEQFLLQRLIRGLGSPHIDHRLRQVDFRGPNAPPTLNMALTELETTAAILLIGSNPRAEHPLVNHYLRKASLAGARITCIHAVRHAFNYAIDTDCIVPPAQLPAALAGVAKALAVGGDQALSALPPSAAEQSIAAQLASAKTALIVLGPMAVAHPEYSLLQAFAAAIAAETGARVGVLSAAANAAGAWYAGAIPGPDHGRDAKSMIDDPLAAYVLLGIEPELDCAHSARARQALRAADFVVCLSAWRTPEMDDYADAVLPIASFAETEGTYVNLQGDWQSFAAAVTPSGEARPAWKVLRVLGNRFDLEGFDQISAQQTLEQAYAAKASITVVDYPKLPQALPPAASGQLQRIGEVPPYATDMLVRRAAPLQQTAAAIGQQQVRIHPITCERLGLSAGSQVRVSQGQASVAIGLQADDTIALDCVCLSAGIQSTIGFGDPCGEVQVEAA